MKKTMEIKKLDTNMNILRINDKVRKLRSSCSGRELRSWETLTDFIRSETVKEILGEISEEEKKTCLYLFISCSFRHEHQSPNFFEGSAELTTELLEHLESSPKKDRIDKAASDILLSLLNPNQKGRIRRLAVILLHGSIERVENNDEIPETSKDPMTLQKLRSFNGAVIRVNPNNERCSPIYLREEVGSAMNRANEILGKIIGKSLLTV